MLCPVCSSQVPPGATTCPTCGSPLATSSTSPTSIPLKAWQKARLLYDCVPLLFFIVASVIYFIFLRDVIRGVPPLAMYLFMGVVIAVLGFQAVQRLRDLMSGVATVQDDVLVRSWRTRGRGRIFFGNFEQLGKMRVMPKAHFESGNGGRYRVAYSPVSKIVWTLDPL